MAFAILQKELVMPDVERLKRAFRVSPYLRDLDAQNAASDAHGILLRGLDEEQADALAGALKAEGVEIELVKESTLPAIQAGKVTKRITFSKGYFVAYDAMDRYTEVPWGDVAFLAAGYVKLGDARKHRTAKEEAQLRAVTAQPTDEHHVLKTGDQDRYHMVLEIFLRDGSAHYSVVADEFLFDEEAGCENWDLSMRFVTLVRELAARAPHAGLNRGALKATGEPPELFPYVSRGAFNEEIVWMLWKIARLSAGK